jgi:signal transduction histidine kinase
MGYTGQSFAQSRDFGWFDAVHPDDRERARLAWVESLRSRWPYEVRVRIWHAASKSYRHIVARAVPLTDENGEVREWVGACTDIHEEAERAQTLLEADRRKDEFLATLAHELRNPLAPILNGLYILRLRGNTEGALANVYQMLDRQVKQLVRLVDDLLEVSRITRGKLELRRERVQLEAVLASALETSRPLVEARQHELALSLPAQPLALYADPTRLAQVVANLLNNAAKYTEPGGRIELRARCEPGCALIEVRDTGVGIPREMLGRIFELFTQLDQSLERTQGGLGIGLTLVKHLVEMHGGSVEAWSEGPGRGSEFRVRVPLAEPHSARGSAPARSASRRPAGADRPRRILVVDDNRDAAESLGLLLELRGHEVRLAYDGYTALASARATTPDVVFLDIGLPGMNGYEVARQLRREPALREIVLVAQTGWGQAGDRQRALDAGFDHHLVKPIAPEDMERVLS